MDGEIKINNHMKYIFEDSIGMLSALVSRKLGIGLEKHFTQNGFSINATEWTVISYLANKGSQTQNQLANTTGKNKVFIKRLIDKLENRGLVSRNTLDRDKRYNNIILSEKGISYYGELLPIVENYIDQSYHHINDLERENMVALLKKILTNVNS